MRTINTYRLTVTAICPVDPDVRDVYDVEIEVAARMLAVEAILAVVRDVTAEPLFQEELTQKLAERLDARVGVIGTHSGVDVESEAEPSE